MMKHLTAQKKKGIIATLPVDDLNDKYWAGIDAAIYLYLSGVGHIKKLPKDKDAEAAEIRRVQRKATAAIKAINELETTINKASSLIKYRSESEGLDLNLKQMKSKLSEWINFEDEVLPRKLGNRPKFFREQFIKRLAFLFHKITGKKATHYTGSEPNSKFFKFVIAHACHRPSLAKSQRAMSSKAWPETGRDLARIYHRHQQQLSSQSYGHVPVLLGPCH